jgi:hypothetical protein
MKLTPPFHPGSTVFSSIYLFMVAFGVYYMRVWILARYPELRCLLPGWSCIFLHGQPVG